MDEAGYHADRAERRLEAVTRRIAEAERPGVVIHQVLVGNDLAGGDVLLIAVVGVGDAGGIVVGEYEACRILGGLQRLVLEREIECARPAFAEKPVVAEREGQILGAYGEVRLEGQRLAAAPEVDVAPVDEAYDGEAAGGRAGSIGEAELYRRGALLLDAYYQVDE